MLVRAASRRTTVYIRTDHERFAPHERPARNGSTKIRIVLADDHVLVLEALAETLNSVPDFDVVGIVSDGHEIVPTVRRLRPTVAILDSGMTDRVGLHLAGQLRTLLPSCGVALIAGQPTRVLVDRAVEAGVLSVIPKHARLPHLIDAVRGVAAGCLTIDPVLLHAVGPEAQTLSDREREILRLAATGASVKEIAKELYLATGTVRNLASAAIKKLDGRNRFDAARIAKERGWL
jgi:two-component system response regulator DesR